MAVTPKIRRTYKGAAPQATLGVSGVTAVDQTTIALSSSPSGWPTGKFFVVVAPGTAYEEKMCVTISGSTLTVVNPNNTSTSQSDTGRGVDDTTARASIPGGSVVYPVFTARDADEANQLTSTYANQGGIVYLGDPSFTQLAIGTASHVLKVNSGATAPEWGQVATAGIADDAVTIDKLADAVVNRLVPVGTIVAYGGASAPTGWLFCDGTTFNATTYPVLNTVLGGNTLPNMAGRVPMGKTASGTGSTLLGTGGSNTISEANLPAHTHNNTLSFNDPGHSHTSQTVFDNVYAASDASRLIASQSGSPNPVPTASSTTGITVSLTNASVGSGTAYFQPFVSVNYIIKHD